MQKRTTCRASLGERTLAPCTTLIRTHALPTTDFVALLLRTCVSRRASSLLRSVAYLSRCRAQPALLVE